jgi:hypothetical protein
MIVVPREPFLNRMEPLISSRNSLNRSHGFAKNGANWRQTGIHGIVPFKQKK